MFRVSVAMATYNGEKYISEQLESLKNQIRQPDEVVIVDDKSTDATVQIINDFIENNGLTNWSVTVNDENLGFKRNFKKALSITNGDIIFLCDQDDVWCEDKIECISGVFAANTNILCVNSTFTTIDSEGNDCCYFSKRGKNNYGLIDYNIKHRLEKIPLTTEFHQNISPGCTSAVRRELAESFVALSDSVMPHDYEMNIMAAAKGGLYFYDAPLIKYRIHSNNTIGFEAVKTSRINIAEERLSAAKLVMDYTGYEELYKTCLKRLRALESKNLIKILKLWLYRDYYKYFTFKECMGDILYVFGRE